MRLILICLLCACRGMELSIYIKDFTEASYLSRHVWSLPLTLNLISLNLGNFTASLFSATSICRRWTSSLLTWVLTLDPISAQLSCVHPPAAINLEVLLVFIYYFMDALAKIQGYSSGLDGAFVDISLWVTFYYDHTMLNCNSKFNVNKSSVQTWWITL